MAALRYGHRHFQQSGIAGTADVLGIDEVRLGREVPVVAAAGCHRISQRAAPVDIRGDRAVGQIPVLDQGTRVLLVHRPTAGTVAGDRRGEDVLQQLGHEIDLGAQDLGRILDQERLVPAVVGGQRGDRRGVPGMQVHADLALAARQYVPPKLDEGGRNRHLVIDEICRLQAEALAKLLKSREVSCITRRDLARTVPNVVSFGINGDDEATQRLPPGRKHDISRIAAPRDTLAQS